MGNKHDKKNLKMALAPIILFVYNRPLHTLKTLEALALNHLSQDSILYIFSDGIKKNADEKTILNINETRKIIKSKQWCKEVKIIERPENFGLAKSIIDGVTKIINQYGKAIVLEDDLVTSRYFLQYMNDSLIRYEHEESVACISGYVYPTLDLPEPFFIKGADCWGWAAWSRSWNLFEPDGKKLLKELEVKKLTETFDFNNSYPYTQMLKDQANKKNNSWAVRWYASCFLKNKLCLYPNISLVQNIGLDGSGVHSGVSENFTSAVSDKPIDSKNIPVVESNKAKLAFQNYFRSLNVQPAESQSIFPKVYRSLVPGKIRQKLYDLRHPKIKPLYGWFGNYKNWEEVEKECSGYDNMQILQKVKSSILKIKSGEAKYERDSVVFSEMQHSQSLIDSFNHSIENNQLHITDFGGSLGSTYFQYREFFNSNLDLKWSVVEQKHFVDCGQKEIAEKNLSFFHSIDEVLKQQNNQVLLLSSVLPYFKEPYELIQQLLKYKFKYIIIDRTAFIDSEHERITKQVVPPFIYEASYPAWFFNENKFISSFTRDYTIVDSFDSVSDPTELLEDNRKAYRKGFYLKLKTI